MHKEPKVIPFHNANIEQPEIDAVVEVLKSKWLSMGPKTISFEDKFSNFIGCKYSIAVSSATAALHLSLKAIGLQPGDEVILPTTTFVATAEVVTYFNAIPVLCDVEYDTHNIDVNKIESLITDKTRAIIPVHFAGQPCDMDEIVAIAKKYNLYVIEDAAHAIPSSYKGKKTGTMSDLVCYSFYPTKCIAMSDGGMVVTNNEQFAKNIKCNRLHGIKQDAWDRYSTKGSWYYEVIDNGYKYNMTDLNAAIGLVQLEKVDKMREKRQYISNLYDKGFYGLSQIKPLVIKSDRQTSYHLYLIKTDNRDELVAKLRESGICTSMHFIPIHRHPYYKDRYGFIASDYPVAEELYRTSLSLPIYPDLSDEDVGRVVSTIESIIRNI